MYIFEKALTVLTVTPEEAAMITGLIFLLEIYILVCIIEKNF